MDLSVALTKTLRQSGFSSLGRATSGREKKNPNGFIRSSRKISINSFICMLYLLVNNRFLISSSIKLEKKRDFCVESMLT